MGLNGPMTPRLFFHKARYWIYFRLQLHRALPALWRGHLDVRYALIDKYRRKQPFIILAAMRTGTNYLISMLHSADISCLGEVLGGIGKRHMLPQRTFADPRGAATAHLRRIIYTQRGPLCGAKIFAWHLDAYQMTPSDVELALPGARYIILYRASLADQYYSYVVAYQSNTWRLKPGQRYADPGPVRLDRGRFEVFCAKIKRAYALYLASPEVRRSAVIVRYEDLKQAPQQVFDQVIFPHLEARRRPVRAGVRPIPHPPKERGVVNYEEVRDLWTDLRYRMEIDPVTFTLKQPTEGSRS